MSRRFYRRFIICVIPLTVIAAVLLYKFASQVDEYKKLTQEQSVIAQEYNKGVEKQEELKEVKVKIEDPEYLKSYAKEKYIYVEKDGKTVLISLVEEEETEEDE